MIFDTGNTSDKADVGMLIFSITTYLRDNHGVGCQIVDTMRVAEEAAYWLHELVLVDDSWDGVVWYEYLESASKGSLAQTLSGCVDCEAIPVPAAVRLWLKINEIQMK